MPRVSLSSECPESTLASRFHTIGIGAIAEKVLWLQASMKGYEIFTPHNNSSIDLILVRPRLKPVSIQIKVALMRSDGSMTARPRKCSGKQYHKNEFDCFAFYVREFERFNFVKMSDITSSYYRFKADRNTLNNWQVIDELCKAK